MKINWKQKCPRSGAFFTTLNLVLLVTGCAQAPQREDRDGKRAPSLPVRTAAVQRIDVQRNVDLVGTLTSPDQARVSSEVGGVIRKVYAELGQEVRRGQILVALETAELTLALRRAESALRQTEAQLGIHEPNIKGFPPDEDIAAIKTALANRDDARAQYARSKQLIAQGLLSQADLDTSLTRMKVNEAAYQAAFDTVRSLKASLQERRAAYELAMKKLNDAEIRAPIGGSVSERLVQEGEFIRENTPVVTIVQMNPLKLRSAVQERFAGQIHPGLPVLFRVESYPDAVFEGKVAFIGPSVNQDTRTFTVEVLVDNTKRQLAPGFFAKGSLQLRTDRDVMAVPEETISTLAGVAAVFVIESGKVRQQPVALGAREGKFVEILDGLKGDEVLAASNLSQLANGVPVAAASSDEPARPQDRSGGRQSTQDAHESEAGDKP